MPSNYSRTNEGNRSLREQFPIHRDLRANVPQEPDPDKQVLQAERERVAVRDAQQFLLPASKLLELPELFAGNGLASWGRP